MGRAPVIAIIVPVLGRPHHIQPLLDSIDEATKDVEYRVLFVCSPRDEATDTCLASGRDTIVVDWSPGPADFAKKVNLGYESSDEDWFFQGATDLVFYQRWASQALRVGRRENVGVVGTNDLGNPMVRRGLQATHILFSREYIETFGGTFDNSGVVFSEAYDHQYVDTEFVQTAQLRGQFKPSRRSVVEHMHPHWGKAEMDDTYRKALRATNKDRAIFSQRMRRMRSVEARHRASRARR